MPTHFYIPLSMKNITYRGIRYIEFAITNLYNRERKLLDAWCSDHEFLGIVTTERQRRLMTISNEIKRQYDNLLKYRNEYLDKQKEEKIRSDHEHIMISCHSYSCRYGTGKAMYRKDYVVGSHICSCGREIMTYEEYQIEKQLRYQQF